MLPGRVPLAESEVDTAVQLVEALSVGWSPGDYRDTYQEWVRELVDAKREGGVIEPAVPPPRSTAVEDLLDALRASVEQARSGEFPDS